jgi:formylglycine-generating enzyme required for sulfatase activity
LYNTNMADPTASNLGGITRSGVDGSYTYATILGRENMPVNWVSFYDAVRFANWLNNGRGNGDTETGAYTLLGGTPIPSNGNINVRRNADAEIFLTSENEWYKAAYYDASSMSYFDYPAASNAPTTCATPGPAPNTANCGNAVRDLTSVGSYTGSASPYGTFDQGGNAFEWTEAIPFNFISERQLRGGGIATAIGPAESSGNFSNFPFTESGVFGFRVAMTAPIPEPGTGLLMLAGLVGLAVRRRA